MKRVYLQPDVPLYLQSHYARSPPWTDWHAIWRIEWRPQRKQPRQILFKSVMGFLGGSTPKMAISYTFSNNPYNSTALPER